MNYEKQATMHMYISFHEKNEFTIFTIFTIFSYSIYSIAFSSLFIFCFYPKNLNNSYKNCESKGLEVSLGQNSEALILASINVFCFDIQKNLMYTTCFQQT